MVGKCDKCLQFLDQGIKSAKLEEKVRKPFFLVINDFIEISLNTNGIMCI